MITNYIDYKMLTVYSRKYIPHTCCIKIMWVCILLQSSTFLPGLNLKVKINIKNIVNISVFIFLFPSTHTITSITMKLQPGNIWIPVEYV